MWTCSSDRALALHGLVASTPTAMCIVRIHPQFKFPSTSTKKCQGFHRSIKRASHNGTAGVELPRNYSVTHGGLAQSFGTGGRLSSS